MVIDFSPRLSQKKTHFDTFETTCLMSSWKQLLDQVPQTIRHHLKKVWLLFDFFTLNSLRRNCVKRRFLQHSKVGQALNAANSKISKDFLHEDIQGILQAETSCLTSSEFVSVSATSGTTSTEGESIGNSWNFHIL